MPYEPQRTAWLLAVLAMLALLVKHERLVRRWFLKRPRRRRHAYARRPVLS